MLAKAREGSSLCPGLCNSLRLEDQEGKETEREARDAGRYPRLEEPAAFCFSWTWNSGTEHQSLAVKPLQTTFLILKMFSSNKRE